MREMARGFESLGDKIGSVERALDKRLKPVEKAVDVHENRFKDMDRAAAGSSSRPGDAETATPEP